MYNVKNKFKKKNLISLIIIILLLIFIFLANNKTGNYTYIEKMFQDLIANIEKKLVPEVDINELVISGINTLLEEENNELKKMLELDSNKYNFIHATVINRDIDWFNEIKIDKGEDSGIKTDMAVISNGGLIGKITKTGKNFSIVKLLSSNSNDMKVSVLVKSDTNTYYGILNGYINKNISVNISKDSKIELGDKVYTSGLGGLYPEGIYIGKIDSITQDKLGLENNILIKSDFSFDALRYVSVVTREE